MFYEGLRTNVGVNLSFYQETPSVLDSGSAMQRFVSQTDLNQFGAIRFMDWGMTNNSSVVDQYPTKDSDWSWSGGPWNQYQGVPIEKMLEMSYRCKSPAWICIPHMASWQCVDDIARRIKAMNPWLPVIIEYSNETWNYGFSQRKWVERNGDNYLSASYKKLMFIKGIFDNVGVKAKYVLGSHFYGADVTKWILDNSPELHGFDGVDAIAVGPYMGTERQNQYARDRRHMEELMWKEWTSKWVPALKKWTKISKEHKTPLIAYEAGLHIIGKGIEISAQDYAHSQEAADWVGRMMQEWGRATDGSLMMWYNLASKYHAQHAWGLIDVNTMTLTHKHDMALAVIRWQRAAKGMIDG